MRIAIQRGFYNNIHQRVFYENIRKFPDHLAYIISILSLLPTPLSTDFSPAFFPWLDFFP